MNTGTRLGFGMAAVAAAGATVALAGATQQVGLGPRELVLHLVVGGSSVAAGLVAWGRPNAGRVARLMVAAGFAWFAAGLGWSNHSLLFTLGVALNGLPLAMFAHLVLAYPTGHVRSVATRVVVVAGYLDAVVVQLLGLAFTPAECAGCPRNLALIAPDPARGQALFDLQLMAAGVLGAAISVILARRWRTLSGPARRALAPVLLSGCGAFALFVYFVVVELRGQSSDVVDTVFHLGLAGVPLAFLGGLVGTRLARGGVADLVLELDDPPRPGALRDALARSLHDPSLLLAYWRPDEQRYVDVHGHTVEVPVDGEGQVTTLIEHRGRRVAAMVHDPALREDPALVKAVGAATALTLENERLQADLRARVDELAASRRRMAEAADAERRHIERNLHDGIQQRLLSLSLSLGLVESKVVDDPLGAVAILADAKHGLSTALDEVRGLGQGIHPAILTERGLRVALEELTWTAGLPVELTCDIDLRLPEPVEVAAYFVVTEALANVAKHARAGHVQVTASTRGDLLAICVADDGVGGADPARGSGVRGLADRVAVLGGRVRVVSPIGDGTRVEAELPCGWS